MGKETIYHPHLPLIIGKVKYCLGDTDLALAELSSDVSYTNELFENSEFQTRRLTAVRPCDSLQFAEALYMDTPFIGLAEAMSPVKPSKWVFSIHKWIGQNTSQKKKKGSCGSVMTDEEGRAGKAIGIAADELATFGTH